jgi:TonB family protein
MKPIFLPALFFVAASMSAGPVVNESPAQPVPPDSVAMIQSLVVVRSLKVLDYVAPVVTSSLRVSALGDQRVRIAVQIDEKGRAVDWLIVAYSRRAFTDNTIDAVRRWQFEPVKIEGVPVPAQTTFDIEFKGADVVSISSVTEQLETVMRNMGIERLEYRPCPLRDLDRIPLLLNAVAPRYAIEARDQGVRGTVEVQFFIDEQGTVRMPAVLQADRLDLAQMALEAVRQWKFEPPTHKGSPVMISAVQHFEFGTGVQSSTTVN